jgi:hypothetical protein
VADVIPLDRKLQLAKEKKDAIIRLQKIKAVQKAFQCSRCALRCEKCGSQIEQAEPQIPADNAREVPYRFCHNCLEEYLDFIGKLQGKGNPDYYWHNEAWLNVWDKWVGYQNAIDQYLKTKEFLKLLNELQQTRIDE